jgi:hypothetical protein
VKIGIRKPSLSRMFAARTSPRRWLAHSMGMKAPRGLGWIVNPRKAAYNYAYRRLTISFWEFLRILLRIKS